MGYKNYVNTSTNQENIHGSTTKWTHSGNGVSISYLHGLLPISLLSSAGSSLYCPTPTCSSMTTHSKKISPGTVSSSPLFVFSFTLLLMLSMVNKPEELNPAHHWDSCSIMDATHFQSLSSFLPYAKLLSYKQLKFLLFSLHVKLFSGHQTGWNITLVFYKQMLDNLV